MNGHGLSSCPIYSLTWCSAIVNNDIFIPYRYVGCHALMLNCVNLTLGDGLLGSSSVYILADLGTSVTLHTGPVAVGVVDGWVVTPGAAPSTIPPWLVQQATGMGINASGTERNCHVLLNSTASLQLTEATAVHAVNLGGHTQLLEGPNASLVTVLDVVPWNGTVMVEGTNVREPAGRYVVSVDGTTQHMVRWLESLLMHMLLPCLV